MTPNIFSNQKNSINKINKNGIHYIDGFYCLANSVCMEFDNLTDVLLLQCENMIESMGKMGGLEN